VRHRVQSLCARRVRANVRARRRGSGVRARRGCSAGRARPARAAALLGGRAGLGRYGPPAGPLTLVPASRRRRWVTAAPANPASSAAPAPWVRSKQTKQAPIRCRVVGGCQRPGVMFPRACCSWMSSSAVVGQVAMADSVRGSPCKVSGHGSWLTPVGVRRGIRLVSHRSTLTRSQGVVVRPPRATAWVGPQERAS
jgi:hypothetical protein